MSDYNLDDTDKDIITLWRQGLSSSAIGKNLGITRNSVAGRVFRMRRAGIEVDVRTSPIKKPHVFFPQKISATVIDDNLPILSMKMDMCRFVMNDGSPRLHLLRQANDNQKLLRRASRYLLCEEQAARHRQQPSRICP